MSAVVESFSVDEVNQFCCLDLMRAAGRREVSIASGGVWLGWQEHGGCSSLTPAKFCPLCGAEIVTTRAEGGVGWSWHTVPRATDRAAASGEYGGDAT